MRKQYVVLISVPIFYLFTVVSISFAQVETLKRAKQLNQQVIQLYQQGKYTEAVLIAKEVLAIREKALGPDHPDVAQSLNNLAGLYDSLGDYAKAEPLYKRSLGIWEKALGPEHPYGSSTFNVELTGFDFSVGI